MHADSKYWREKAYWNKSGQGSLAFLLSAAQGLIWVRRVKAKTLSRIRSGSRVRSGPGQVLGLRLLTWFGLDD
jgi:hypothetical protein